MRLVYTTTQQPVRVGDTITNYDGRSYTVEYFAQPHKPASSGKITVCDTQTNIRSEYYVGVIGAEWIEREDRDDQNN